jgi:uncharacterized oligopeptide transporter (OPT) family protein
VLAILLSFVTSVLAVRSLAETKILPNGALAKILQLIFGVLVPSSNTNAVIINLIAASMSESSTSRAGNTAQNYKTAQLVGTSARMQLLGSLIGGAFGAIISPVIYRLYASVYELPSGLFQIPSARLYVFAARLLTGQGLPRMVPEMSI